MSRLGAILGASWVVLERREAETARMPKSFNHLRKINDFCLLGTSWQGSWRPLGASGSHLGRFGAILWRIGALLDHIEGLLGASWLFLGLSGGPRGRRPGGKPSLGRTARDLAGVLFVRGPPGAAPRARSRNIVKQLPEILARLWPVGPANFPVRWNGPTPVIKPRRALSSRCPL